MPIRRGLAALFFSGSVLLGLALSLGWLYFEAGNLADEIAYDNWLHYRAVRSILSFDFRRRDIGARPASQRAVSAVFADPNIIKAEITDSKGLILGAKDSRLVGRLADEARKIAAALDRKRSVSYLWALESAGDLSGKKRLSGISPFDWRPKAHEFIGPISFPGRPVLVLHMYLSADRLADGRQKLVWLAAALSVGFAALGATVTYLTVDRLIYKPMTALNDVAERIADGDLNIRAEPAGSEEFRNLAATFNKTTDRLVMIQKKADTDGLTGLFNYRHMESRLASQVMLASRYHREFSVAMLDIDYFKEINDRYGHQKGDEILREVAKRIKVKLRQVDYLARYGGEEFFVLLPETKIDRATDVLERVRLDFQQQAFVFNGEKRWISVSVGVAAYPVSANSAHNLLAAADRALLLSKRRGRNRVTSA